MYTIRPAQSADIPAVIRLTELWAAEPSTTGHYPVNRSEELQRRLGRYFWVAEANGVVVGFIVGQVNSDSAHSLHYQVLREGEDHLSLEQIYMHPAHRNQGAGGQLVQRLLEEAASQGIHRHFVMSMNQDWLRTIRFYQKHGFRPWYFQMFTGPSTEELRNASDE
jgi:N-acetylglutamate synthase-like GNAT family acetyltransferase